MNEYAEKFLAVGCGLLSAVGCFFLCLLTKAKKDTAYPIGRGEVLDSYLFQENLRESECKELKLGSFEISFRVDIHYTKPHISNFDIQEANGIQP